MKIFLLIVGSVVLNTVLVVSQDKSIYDFSDVDSLYNDITEEDKVEEEKKIKKNDIANSPSKSKKDTFNFNNVFNQTSFDFTYGILNYFGDIKKEDDKKNRYGFKFNITHPITHKLNLNASFWKGDLEVSNYSKSSNFYSTLTGANFSVGYNFSNFKNFLEKIKIVPQVQMGVGFLNFISKTDLVDASAKPYFYWDDGTIRDIDQNSILAPRAQKIERDFNYETNFQKLDGTGNYTQQSFVIPISFSIKKYFNQWYIGASTTFYITNTDYIDGITDKTSIIGNKNNDIVQFTGLSIGYSIKHKNKAKYLSELSAQELIELKQDEDRDGVADFIDKCKNTPKDTEINDFGCPISEDGMVQYIKNAIIDTSSIASPYNQNVTNASNLNKVIKGGEQSRLIEILIQSQYLTDLNDEIRENELISYQYNDEDQDDFDRNEIPDEAEFFLIDGQKIDFYTVRIGLFSEIIDTTTLMFKNTNDIFIRKKFNKYIYYSGKFNNYNDANFLKKILKDKGFTDSYVVPFIDGEPQQIQSTEKNKFKIIEQNQTNEIESKVNDKELKYRIQIGAFSQKIPKGVIKNYKEKLNSIPYIIRGKDGYIRYFVGKFYTRIEAEKELSRIKQAGFSDAFIRVTGVNNSKIGEDIDFIKSTQNQIQGLVYKIQLGAYTKKYVRTKDLDIFKKISDNTPSKTVKMELGDDGIKRYILGDFNTYEEAKKQLKNIKKYLEGAFILSFFKNNKISVDEALQLSKSK